MSFSKREIKIIGLGGVTIAKLMLNTVSAMDKKI